MWYWAARDRNEKCAARAGGRDPALARFLGARGGAGAGAGAICSSSSSSEDESSSEEDSSMRAAGAELFSFATVRS